MIHMMENCFLTVGKKIPPDRTPKKNTLERCLIKKSERKQKYDKL